MRHPLPLAPALKFVQTDNGWYLFEYFNWEQKYTPRDYARAVEILEYYIETFNPPPATRPATAPEDHFRTAEEALAELKLHRGTIEAVKERFLDEVEKMERLEPRDEVCLKFHADTCREIMAYIEELESK